MVLLIPVVGVTWLTTFFVLILEFANDHRILVEPACGAALAAIYSKKVQFEKGPVVVEVCGGSGVNLDLLQQWKVQFDL